MSETCQCMPHHGQISNLFSILILNPVWKNFYFFFVFFFITICLVFTVRFQLEHVLFFSLYLTRKFTVATELEAESNTELTWQDTGELTFKFIWIVHVSDIFDENKVNGENVSNVTHPTSFFSSVLPLTFFILEICVTVHFDASNRHKQKWMIFLRQQCKTVAYFLSLLMSASTANKYKIATR